MQFDRERFCFQIAIFASESRFCFQASESFRKYKYYDENWFQFSFRNWMNMNSYPTAKYEFILWYEFIDLLCQQICGYLGVPQQQQLMKSGILIYYLDKFK
jgi:hypothetical protein